MLKRLVNEACLTLMIETTGPLLIKSGHATLIGADMTPVLTFRNGGSQVFIPGPSLKGVFRSHLEKILRTLRPEEVVVADPFQNADQPDQSSSAWFQQRKNAEEKELDSPTVYTDSDPISRLFGSTFFIGRLSIGDAYLIDPKSGEFLQGKQLPTETRNGVGIDRLTGGSSPRALFDLEVVSSRTAFRADVLLRNFECWQLGALLLVIQDLQDSLLRLGSGTSRGLGAVTGRVEEVRLHHLGPTPGRGTATIWGLGRFLGDGSYGTQPDDALTLAVPPTQSQRGLRSVQHCTGEALQALLQQAIKEFARRMEVFPAYKSRSQARRRA